MKLNPQYYKATNQLLPGTSGVNTAAKIGVTPEKVNKWKGDFDFMVVVWVDYGQLTKILGNYSHE